MLKYKLLSLVTIFQTVNIQICVISSNKFNLSISNHDIDDFFISDLYFILKIDN